MPLMLAVELDIAAEEVMEPIDAVVEEDISMFILPNGFKYQRICFLKLQYTTQCSTDAQRQHQEATSRKEVYESIR